MATEPFEFWWFVRDGGYRWEEYEKEIEGEEGVEIDEAVVLTSKAASGMFSSETRRYNPLDKKYSGLFREFARTAGDPDAMLEFANRYGTLLPYLPRIGFKESIKEEVYSWSSGETLAFWESQAEAMSRVVRLSDMVAKEDSEAIRRHLLFDESRGLLYDSLGRLGDSDQGQAVSDEATEIVGFEDLDSRIKEYLRPDDEFQRALYYIQAVLNRWLKPRLSPGIRFNEDQTRLGVFQVPDSLIGALWLQVAEAVQEGKEYRKCRQCSKTFELDPATHRRNAYYCSDKCRQREYRMRTQARKLHQEGCSDDEIAARLEVNEETVERWLARDNARPKRPK